MKNLFLVKTGPETYQAPPNSLGVAAVHWGGNETPLADDVSSMIEGPIAAAEAKLDKALNSDHFDPQAN